MLNLSQSLIEYEKIKEMKVIQILDYLDVGEKKNRIEKMEERVNVESNWDKQLNQQAPKKII